MAKDISLSDASAGGYMNNAIQSLQRISATTFDMRDLYGQDHSTIKDIVLSTTKVGTVIQISV